MILVLDSVPWTEYDFDTVWKDMRSNTWRASFWLARADLGAQKSQGKGKQVPKDNEEGPSKKRKRSIK